MELKTFAASTGKAASVDCIETFFIAFIDVLDPASSSAYTWKDPADGTTLF